MSDTTHTAAASIADMILDPKNDEKREAAIEALIVAPDEEYVAAIDALLSVYPQGEPLRILLAALRASNKRKGGTA